MKATDIIRSRGQVSPSFINIKTGEKIPFDLRHNTISYDASFAMAAAFGGDSSYIPNRIGIIYGADQEPQFSPTIERDQTWAKLRSELAQKNADVQVKSFSCTPTLKTVTKGGGGASCSSSASSSSSPETPTDPISGRSITFHSHSDSVTVGAFGTYNNESASYNGNIFTSNTYIYQAVLLNLRGEEYKILARASLINGSTYYKKPENFEIAIDWAIKFF